MPSVHQRADLPPPKPTDSLVTWAKQFLPAIQRQFTTSIYTLNAMIRVGTAAQRPATPPINDSIWYSSDTGAVYIGSAGAWVAFPDLPDRIAMQFIGLNVAGGATTFLGRSDNVTETVVAFSCPVTGNVKALYTAASVAPGAGKTLTYTMRVNAGDTAITHTVVDTATLGSSTGTVAVTAGQLVSVKLVTSATAATASHMASILVSATA